MNTIKLIARGLVSGQVRLTPELLEALRQLAAQGHPGVTTVVTITEEVVPGTPPASASPARIPRFGRLVSALALPPRRRCGTPGFPTSLPEGPPSL